MDEINRIKKLANEIGEHSFFSITKRGIMITMEVIGWLSSLLMLIVSLSLFFYLPSIAFPLNESTNVEMRIENNPLKETFHLLSFLALIVAFMIVIMTIFIRRTRKKKAKIHELTTLIKALK
jgi:hypothetical protein